MLSTQGLLNTGCGNRIFLEFSSFAKEGESKD